MKPATRILAFILMLCIVMPPLSGCKNRGNTPDNPGESGVEEQENNQVEEEKKPEATSRLTGLPIDKELANRRPVAIMINNLKKALPQYGIANAGIIFEALAEGGITRLLAVFEDFEKIEKIGTIRSARPYYLDLAQGIDAIYIHLGGSPAAYSEISKRKMDSFDYISGANSGMYWRDKERIRQNGYEHSAFTSGDRIMKRIRDVKMRTEVSDSYKNIFSFGDSVNAEGRVASQITVPFSSYKTGFYKYDKDTEVYLISQYGTAHMDARIGMQLAFKNVFILYINSYVLKGDKEGRLGMDIVGSGNGVYLTRGMAYDIKWKKSAHDAPFKLETPDGNALTILPGDSYIAIVPPSAAVKIEAPESEE